MQFRNLNYEQFLAEPKRRYILGYSKNEDVILDYREAGIKYRITIEKYPWYFYVKKEALLKNQSLFSEFVKSNKIYDQKDEGEYVRLYCRNINRRAFDPKTEVLTELEAQEIQTFEADLSSHQKCLIDHKLEIEDDYRVLYFDIETDDRGKGIVIGRDRILSIACINQEGKIYYYTDKDEKKILKKFLDLIDEYDIIAGWNSEKFDVPYIRERLIQHNIWYSWKQILQVDLMQKLMELNRKNTSLIKIARGFSLNVISEYFLGEKKVEHTLGIYEMYEKNPELLKKYNIQDVVLLKKLDDKLKLIKQKIVEHRITGCFLDEYAISRILDVYILRNADRFSKRKFRTKPKWKKDDSNESGYAGGYVIEPIRGVHRHVYHFDFTSLYPSIIQTFNISPETWIRTYQKDEKPEEDAIKTPNLQLYSREIGIIPAIIAELLVARNNIRYNELKKYKEGTREYETLYYMQYAFKTLANSFYGILGAPFTRYYKLENAEGITLSGHYLIKLAKRWFEADGHQVLYGDTDSFFVKSDKEFDPEDKHKEINQFIDFHLSKYFNVIDSKIDLKVEAIYDSILLVDKKRYVKVEDGELKIVGLEAKRRETLKLTADAQIKLFEMLLLENKDEADVIKWLENLKDYVLHKMKEEDLILQIKLSKDVGEYDKKIKDDFGNVMEIKESKLAHVKVAKWLMAKGIKEDERNTWEKGCYVKYIVTGHKPKIEATSIYNFDGNYDSAYYWNVKVYAILQRVLEVVFPEHNWAQYLIEVPSVRKPRKI